MEICKRVRLVCLSRKAGKSGSKCTFDLPNRKLPAFLFLPWCDFVKKNKKLCDFLKENENRVFTFCHLRKATLLVVAIMQRGMSGYVETFGTRKRK